MRDARRCALAATIAVLIGCGDDGSVRADAAGPSVPDYATSCVRDEDCLLVDLSTDPCCSGCTEAAISRSDEARYREDRAELRATCASTAPCPAPSCPSTVAVCESSTCGAQPTIDAGR